MRPTPCWKNFYVRRDGEDLAGYDETQAARRAFAMPLEHKEKEDIRRCRPAPKARDVKRRRLCTHAYFVLYSQTEGKKRADNGAVALVPGRRRSFEVSRRHGSYRQARHASEPVAGDDAAAFTSHQTSAIFQSRFDRVHRGRTRAQPLARTGRGQPRAAWPRWRWPRWRDRSPR